MSHSNKTFSNNLTEGENQFLQHMSRFGVAGYPVRMFGRKWSFEKAFGVGGSPSLCATKKEAVGRVDAYLAILGDRIAGRLEPSPLSPAALEMDARQRVAVAQRAADTGPASHANEDELHEAIVALTSL